MSDLATDTGGPFFRRLDWSAFWTATLITLAVYVYTLAPTVTLEDSGELAVAGDFLGVPHPPGYPIWTLLSWFFSGIFSFVTFRGQPNPAWSIGLVSAVFGALAAGLAAMLVCRSGSDLLRHSRDSLHRSDPRTEDRIAWIAGVVSSLLFAFSPVEWSQSTIIEVYSLNAFFLIFIFLLTYRWICRPADGVLVATAFVFGLGLTNYQVLLLAALPLVIAIMLRDMRLFRSFLVVGGPLLIMFMAISKGWLPPIASAPPQAPNMTPIPMSPLTVECFVYLAMNLLILSLAYFFIPRGKVIALTILMAEVGVAFYAYMPLVSDLRNPPMNWGFPRTWEGFNHALSRGQYERLAPTDVFSRLFIEQIGSYFTDLRAQFTLPMALLGFLPFAAWRIRLGGRQWSGLDIGIAMAVLAVLLLALERAADMLFGISIWRFDKLFALGVLLATAIGGVTILAHRGWDLWDRFRDARQTPLADRLVIVGVALVAVAGYAYYLKMLALRAGELTAPLRHAATGPLPSDVTQAIIVETIGLVILMLVPPVAGGLIAWLTRSRHRLEMLMDDYAQSWVVATLAGFLVMSLLLIVLANPKGDIQDAFIQRVKFISSHALFAFWMGYGLLFGLAWVDTVFRRWTMLRTLSLAAALALPLLPILQNAYNDELIRVYGGAEQHGHDFGWQFGNYQLRGAAAILEELEPDEEPLPNPTFPPAMGTNAIFYGGTDPGRFVPTYMIYSARVREDVYLITQNALADNTYMSVMRDLYGDRIWIPAQQDSAQAFRIYVEEVQSGKRQAHAELQVDQGRVQVSGALGVMEINGILAQMIFERNKYRHDFYIEESYVIPWMYPYLTPHGLIMKINAEPIPLTPELARHDLDFWDWYTRRLHGNEKFLRDVVARKSFSKLRSALGGLYSNRGMMRNAETAFHQARILYPLSPEANFRLVQEVLLREGRFAEARQIMQEYALDDPGNRRVPEFVNHLDRIVQMDDRIRALETERRSGTLDVESVLELTGLYLQAQQPVRMLELADAMLANPNLPVQHLYQLATLLYQGRQYARMDTTLERLLPLLPANTPGEVYLNMARMYLDAQMPHKMAVSLQRYLEVNPGDWKGWLDMAYIFITAGETNAAIRALQQARQTGGSEAERTIQSDGRFQALFQSQTSMPPPAMDLMQLPGMGPAGRRQP